MSSIKFLIAKILSKILSATKSRLPSGLRGLTPQQLKHSLITIFLLAILSLAIWLYEIVAKIGWASLDWLNQDLFSPYLLCFFVAVAYIHPFWVRYRNIDGKLILTTLTLFILNISVFLLSDVVLRTIFSRLGFLQSSSYKFNTSMGLILLFGLGYFFITDKLIFKIKAKYALLFLACPFLMFVFGVTTNFFIRGFATSWGLVDAVKMGFPQFWICVLIGVLGIYISSLYDENTEGVVVDEKILDDML
jgi:MFS family permease